MAEILSPGVYIEEVSTQTQVTPGVSTSNAGFVGFTEKGPDSVQLVTSFEAYSRQFGGFVASRYTPHCVAAFFANGGRRAYIKRIVPADADKAQAKMVASIVEQAIDSGTGAWTKLATTTLVKANEGLSPVVPGSFSAKWRHAGAAVTGGACKTRSGAALLTSTGVLVYEGRIDPAALIAVDESLNVVLPTTATLEWSITGPAQKTLVLNTVTGKILTGTNGAGSTGILDCVTGFFSLSIHVSETPLNAAPVICSYTPMVANTVSVSTAGVVSGDAAGTFDHATGAYSLTPTVPAHASTQVLATYQIDNYEVLPVSAGEWGNKLRIALRGNENSYVSATGSFGRFDAFVEEYNTSLQGYSVVEQFPNVSVTDPADSRFLPDVINDLSKFVRLTEPGGEESFDQLNAHAYSRVLAAGAGAAAISSSVGNGPIQPRTVVMTFTTGGVSKTITDDGAGNLIGDVNPAGTNTIVYSTGAVEVTLSGVPDVATLVRIAYYKAPAEAIHRALLGDQTKYTWDGSSQEWTAGTNGSFDSTNYGRDQFTAPGLVANSEGLYAFNRVRELMNVVIPDFAGDTVITGDILDYVDGRETMPHGGDRFAVLTTPSGLTASEVADWMRYTLNRTSKFAAMYWPWINVSDPLSDGRNLLIPSVGHVCGIFARTDARRNVAKSPAGTVDGQLRYLTSIETIPTQGEQDILMPARVNTLLSGPNVQNAVWGARTMSNDTAWRYIAVRRMFMFLESSIYNSTHWVVFENNGPDLWGRVKSQIESFLLNLFNDGYFAGSNASEAFRVTINSSNNPPEVVDAGRLNVDIAVSPTKPAEFVVFRVAQMTLAA